MSTPWYCRNASKIGNLTHSLTQRRPPAIAATYVSLVTWVRHQCWNPVNLPASGHDPNKPLWLEIHSHISIANPHAPARSEAPDPAAVTPVPSAQGPAPSELWLITLPKLHSLRYCKLKVYEKQNSKSVSRWGRMFLHVRDFKACLGIFVNAWWSCLSFMSCELAPRQTLVVKHSKHPTSSRSVNPSL